MAPKVKASAKKYGTRKAEANINKTTAGAVAKKTARKTTGKKPPARAAGSRGATAGPEAPAGAARDTAVVLRSLFEKARESVILAGYSFDHAEDVLTPLYTAMRDHGVSAAFFVDIPQLERHSDAHVARAFKRFLAESWPFGEPRPRLFFDKRALKPGPPWCSIHAKCVVVDGAGRRAPLPCERVRS